MGCYTDDQLPSRMELCSVIIIYVRNFLETYSCPLCPPQRLSDCVPAQDHRGAGAGPELAGDSEQVGQVRPRREADTVELQQVRALSRSVEELDLCPLLAGPPSYLRPQQIRADCQQVQL